MKVSILIILVFTVFTCSGKTEKIDSLLNKYTSTFPDSTQLSIGLINNGEIEYYGFIKIKENLIPIMNKNAVFEIGSITKVFTSTLLAQIITDGKTELNEPIEKLLPFTLNSSDFDNSKITLKTLSNHTSGLPEMPENYMEFFNDSLTGKIYDIKILEDYLKKGLTLINEPGKEFLYSNLGYAILGYLIEKLENSEYEKLLQQFICEKHKLESTTTQFTKVRGKIVEGKNATGNTIENKELGVFKSTGGIMSSVVDLVKFIKANFENDSLLEYQRKETYRWGNSAIALGWQITNIGNNCNWYFHNGKMDGYSSSLFMDVPSKTAVVILSNLSVHHPDNDNIDNLAFELMKNEYLSNKNATFKNAFIEEALKEGWGTHILGKVLKTKTSENSIVGVWIRKNNNQTITRTFTKDNKVQTDFYKDKEIDVWGYYETNENQITFNDIGGAACNLSGTYEYQLFEDTLRFKIIFDNCDGRKADLLNEWTRMKK